jgi:hypothetical protein
VSGYDFAEGVRTVRKRVFSRHFILKLISLPRHAREKHRENSKKDAFLQGCAREGPDGCEDEDEDCVLTQCTDRSSGAGKKTAVFALHSNENDHFYQDRLGTSIGHALKKRDAALFFL